MPTLFATLENKLKPHLPTDLLGIKMWENLEFGCIEWVVQPENTLNTTCD